MIKILSFIGTRPEAIKLAPILALLGKNRHFESRVCVTYQHTDLLKPLLSKLGVITDYEFEGSKQSLPLTASKILQECGTIFEQFKPAIVLVQGDTTTAFAAALAAFYARIPIGHVEAGLRTGNLHSPWPEEAHRSLVDRLATYFFAPTEDAKNSLIAEGTSPERIWVVGNTSMDALRLLQKPAQTSSKSRKILVTVHRRENQGEPLKEICHALNTIAEQFPDVEICIFLHPNPAIQHPVKRLLSHVRNIHLREPVDHLTFIHLLDESLFVITDSGGIQEEAPFIGKPVLIIRDTTERPEGIIAGTAKLVGTNSDAIISSCQELLNNPKTLAEMSKVHYSYGDGYAAERIVNVLEQQVVRV